MKERDKLLTRITQRVNINLRELGFDVRPFVENLVPLKQMVRFYAFYGITPHHPLNFQFRHSSLAGSYFLGRCRVSDSLLYKSDIRGDELKKKGGTFHFQGITIPVSMDEEIRIEDSFLVKTLVHNYSHDPETLETFFIKDTVSTHYANIHGSPCDGCFIGPFATVDLTTTHDCVIGAFSYVQAGEIGHMRIDPGTIWVRQPGTFNFLYRYPVNLLSTYVHFEAGGTPHGILIDFVEDRKQAFQTVFDSIKTAPSIPVPNNASLDRFAVVNPSTHIGENVLVAQRAFLQNAWLGKGANAQENCYIVNSRLEGNNVSAHGAKIIEACLGENVFVGFNSFLRGRPDSRLAVGRGCIIMPHTLVDIREPVTIPPDHLVWGLIRNQQELITNSIALEDLAKIDVGLVKGNMLFEGSGAAFVNGFQERIHHILEANGAFYDGFEKKGHAQKNQNISFNIIQPYPEDDLEGIYPTIVIQP